MQGSDLSVQYLDGTKLGDKDLAPGLVVSTREEGGGGERESSGDLNGDIIWNYIKE